MRGAFAEYLQLVFRHWWAIVISYVVSGFGLIVLIQADISIAGWVWGAVAIGGLAVSQFLAFCDAKKERDELRARRVKQVHVDQLARLRSEAISSILNSVPKTEADLAAWTETHNKWMTDVTNYLESHFSSSDRLKFERIGLIKQMPFFPFQYNREHGTALGHFAIRLERLESIIDLHRQKAFE